MDSIRNSVVLLFVLFFAANAALAKEIKEAERDGVKLVLGSDQIPRMLGEMVPFAVSFEAPLGKGEKLAVFADTTHLAYVVTPRGRFLLREFRGRVRMNDGALKAVVERTDGTTTEVTQSVRIDQPFSIPENGKPDKRFAVRAEGNRMKLIHANRMALTNYVKQIDISVADGALNVAITPDSSGMAYYWIEAEASLEGSKVDIQLADTPFNSPQ